MTVGVDARDRRNRLLGELYGDRAGDVVRAVDARVASASAAAIPRPQAIDETAAWLIAYPDQVASAGMTPLATLHRFVSERLAPAITGVHTLPIHPSSGDGGFSVVDPSRVEPRFGDWSDVDALAAGRVWMADAVVNHMSASSTWFRGFLDDDPEYERFFARLPPGVDTSEVVRPRTTPLAHEFRATSGRIERVWTTFSADQIDLDYRNPGTLVAMTEVILRYVRHGARAIRLDAVAFLWKDPATASVHLVETHAIVKFLRAVLDEVSPGVVLVTETNAPHTENVSYLGDGEANAVYQFALPPLVLHAMLSGSTVALQGWARALSLPPGRRTFLNFLASHDGIGLRAAEDRLDATAIDRLTAATTTSGGVVNLRSTAAGAQPYELAASWFELMKLGHDEPDGIARHLVSHAIALAMRGVPLLYFNSLFGIGHDNETYRRTGHGRDLNRGRSRGELLARDLDDPGSRAARVWSGLRRMLEARASHPAFHPASDQVIHDSPEATIVIERRAPGGQRAVVAVNVTGAEQPVELPRGSWTTMTGEPRPEHVVLGAWEAMWLRTRDGASAGHQR